MTNWHNEVFREEEEFKTLKQKNEKNKHIRCEICGTRTGLHGFSFDTKK